MMMRVHLTPRPWQPVLADCPGNIKDRHLVKRHLRQVLAGK
jgi:hypothetical protein